MRNQSGDLHPVQKKPLGNQERQYKMGRVAALFAANPCSWIGLHS